MVLAEKTTWSRSTVDVLLDEFMEEISLDWLEGKVVNSFCKTTFDFELGETILGVEQRLLLFLFQDSLDLLPRLAFLKVHSDDQFVVQVLKYIAFSVGKPQE